MDGIANWNENLGQLYINYSLNASLQNAHLVWLSVLDSDNHVDILALLNWYLWCLFILLQGHTLRNASRPESQLELEKISLGDQDYLGDIHLMSVSKEHHNEIRFSLLKPPFEPPQKWQNARFSERLLFKKELYHFWFSKLC